MTKNTPTKRRNPNDGTLRNVQAANKRFSELEARYLMLTTLMTDVRRRLQRIEDLPPPQKVL